MIINVLAPDYQFRSVSLDWIQTVDLEPPGHLVIELLRPYDSDVLKIAHYGMVEDVLKDYPHSLGQFVLPYHFMACWYDLVYHDKGTSCQDIPKNHAKDQYLVYYLSPDHWDSWQCFS